MGEETDGAIESVSKLQEKIKALSGVDILTDAGDYKDTYTILKEIGTVWEDMSDIDQAALLELMAGKNRANTLSAILSNMKDLEGAYESAMNAEGSALRENEAYLDSIQGRMDLFTNALQTFWMNFIDSNVVKGVVDAGTGLMKFLDTLVGKITAVVAAYMAFQKFKNGVKFTDMFKGVADGAKAAYSSIMSMVTATQTVTKADIARALAAKGLNSSLKEQIIAEAGLKGVKTALTAEQIKAATATLTEKFTTDQLTASQYLAAMSTMGLKTALQGLWQVLIKNPIYLVAAAVAALALAFDHFNTTAQEAADAAQEAFDKIKGVVDTTKSAIQSLESELSTLQDKINELDGKKLSFVEDQELQKLKVQREELEHSLKVQQQLLELQRDSSNKQAVATMKAYTKASSEGAEQTQKAWQKALTIIGGIVGVAGTAASVLIPGDFGTIGAGALAAGKAIASSGGVAAIAGGAYAGNKAGEALGSGIASNEGTYDAWYETYTKALDTARKEEQKALEKYQKDSSNIDKLDKWQEAQKKTSDIETEMYNHLSQMQQYFNDLEYGASDEINKELDTWYNFLDKFSIDQGASGSEATALDRIFGENASEEIKLIKTQIEDAVSSGKDFDFTTAINGSQELNNILQYVGLNAEDVKNYFTQIGEAAQGATAEDVTPVTSYADLLSTIENFNDIQRQTEEIVINNTKVTEEYKEALVELVGSEEEVNEYFDDNNKLIVKDAKGLNKLVQTTKKNAASTAALAKTQARLQYAEMYQELKNLVNGQTVSNTARLQEIVALYHEMNAIEKTIMRYSVLEEQLLGAANAYEKFARAQEIDAQTDYIASAEDMVLALGEAFNTAELGTETAQTAIAGLVPESVYKDLDTVDEKMAAIYKYFKEGKVAQYFDLEFDDDGAITGVEMKLGNLRKFIEDGLAGGVFEGSDWMHFDLSEDITSLEDFAAQMGVTKEVAFAFLETLEDHDIEWLNGDYTSLLEKLLPPNLENDIYKNTSALADLEMQLATGKISAEEYATTYAKLASEETKLADRAREETAAWYDKTEQLESYKTQLQEYQKQLETGVDSDGNVIDTSKVEQNIKEVTGYIDTLSAELAELEEPTELTLQVALEDIQEELDTLEQAFEDREIDINAHLKWDNENNEWTVSDDSELKGDKEVQQYVELKNDQVNLETLLDDGIVSTDEHLSDIKEITQDIRALLGGEAQDSGQTIEASSDAVPSTSQSTEEDSSGTIDDFKLKAQELFNTTLPTAWDEFWGNVDTFFDGLGEQANALKESLGTFFTETVPEKWNEFWDGVGEFFAEVAAKADILRENITAFFTETVPEKWDEFWDNADKFFTESLPYAIGYAAGAVTRFFTETIPQKWDEFWTKAGEVWGGIQEWATSAKDAVVTFFTQTIPTAWSNFWTSVGVFIDESVIPALQSAGDAIKTFFTETIPTKWSEFWTGVGNFITETLIPALQAAKDKVTEFFLTTIPEKWSEFWSSVGTFFGETVPQALESVKEGVTTFFTQTIPNAINNLWTSIASWISEKVSTFWSNLTSGFTAGKSGESGESGTAGVNGTAHVKGTVRTGKAYKGGSWGAPRTETALTGELGPEILVRGNRWTTVGENGAEFTQVKKGDIIFNHKQSEQLLKNGHIASRGKAYAGGTAYNVMFPQGSSKDQWEGTGYSSWDDPTYDAAEALKDAASDLSDAADDFRETFDWIEIRLEEIDEKLGLKQAQLENAVGSKAQNAIIDDMIDINQQLYNTLTASAAQYYAHAKTLLGKIPAAYQKAAQDGSIAITEFAGEAGEKTMNAIQEYRDWVQKGADATQQAEEVITEIRSLAKQSFDNISDQYDRKNSLPESRIAKLEAAMGLAEEQGKPGTAAYYNALKANTNTLIEQKEKERAELQADLDNKVKLGPDKGGIKKYSPEWYEMVNDILAVDEEILDLKTDVESYDNAIQDLHWEAFDENIERLQNISEETQSLIDLLSETDLFDENGVWTDEGIATIGLYGQQMENAKLQASKYAKEIEYLKKQYDAGAISEQEYTDQLAELKKGQQDAIKEYNNATDAIYDLQKARVDEIKNGIDKEIEAYEELIKKKKEALSSEQDLYSFRKSISEKNKDIAEIERKLAALAGDQSMAAQAKRARLEADLAEAKAEREEMYYERSVENQQEAYDKSLENFTAEKEAEKEEWDKQLEDTKQMVADAFDDLAQKAGVVHDTLTGLAAEYGITLSDAILTPWENGENAMDTYWSSFTTTGSDAITALKAELQSFQDALNTAKQDAKDTISGLKTENQQTVAATNPTKTTTQTNGGKNNGKNNGTNQTKAAPKVGSSVTVKTSATHFSAQSGNKKMASFVPGGQYTVYETMGSGNNTQVLIGKNGVYTGWVKLTDLKGYASGTTGVTKDQLAWIDELGLEELVMHADGNGRLAYLTKGSSVIPHDLTENLMSWGALDPTNMLEDNRPSIGVSPEVHNTEINLDCSVGTLVNIEHCDQGTLPDVEKMVNKAFEKHMQNLNNSLKKFVR